MSFVWAVVRPWHTFSLKRFLLESGPVHGRTVVFVRVHSRQAKINDGSPHAVNIVIHRDHAFVARRRPRRDVLHQNLAPMKISVLRDELRRRKG
jgi:hypothetical protein